MARTSLAIAALAALFLGGCAGTGGARGGSVPVVSAENFYGNITQQIGGSHVTVTSIIKDAAADPHQYASNTQDTQAVANARLVVINGGGYDSFMDRLVAASPSSARVVIHVDALGSFGASDRNPHLWYDTPTVARLARAVGAQLVSADPRNAPSYRSGTGHVIASLEAINAEIGALRKRFAGVPFAYTERVPAYLTARIGLALRTPPEFAKANEDGSDPPPQSVATMRSLVATRQIKLLLYNSQASSRAAATIRDLAKRSGVPVVAVSETSPPGLTYQAWQLGQLRAIGAALSHK